MGRRRIPMQRITDKAKESTTAKSRQFGLLKKAGQLVVLTNVNCFVFCQTSDGVVSVFSSEGDPISHMQNIKEKILSEEQDACVQTYNRDNILQEFVARKILYRHPKKAEKRKKKLKLEVGHSVQYKSNLSSSTKSQGQNIRSSHDDSGMDMEYTHSRDNDINLHYDDGQREYATHSFTNNVGNMDNMPPEDFNRLWQELARRAKVDLTVHDGDENENSHFYDKTFSSGIGNSYQLETHLNNNFPSTTVENMSRRTQVPFKRTFDEKFSVNIEEDVHGGLEIQTTRTISLQDKLTLAREDLEKDWKNIFEDAEQFVKRDLKSFSKSFQ